MEEKGRGEMLFGDLRPNDNGPKRYLMLFAILKACKPGSGSMGLHSKYWTWKKVSDA